MADKEAKKTMTSTNSDEIIEDEEQISGQDYLEKLLPSLTEFCEYFQEYKSQVILKFF